jgi:hypothetical protein
VAPRDPGAGGKGDLLPLSSGDAFEGMDKSGPAAAFYLHKRDEPTLFHHEVDLPVKKKNVTIEDPPPCLFQEGLDQQFETASAACGIQE